jgi:hypothetical protein
MKLNQLLHQIVLICMKWHGNLTYVGGRIVCEWFTSGWLRITIQIESCDSSVFSSRFLRRRRSITSRCWLIVRTSTHREAVKGKMSIGRSITGGHKTSPSCLSRSHDRTTMPSTIRTWGGYKRGMTIIWYNMNTNEHLSQPLPHPEEPVDELSYVPHSYQNARAVSI